ncbi:hypothetical protein FB451DRAFT_1441836 [Mycena latifolia]|nr:hypothetical protein FB451DRAFT_1441836 [Mycena latifolia]
MAPRGRPLGSKDGPRPKGAPRRGRPPKDTSDSDGESLKMCLPDNSSDWSRHPQSRCPEEPAPRTVRKKPNPQRRKMLATNQANPWTLASSAVPVNATASTSTAATDARNDFYFSEDTWGPAAFDEMDRIEREAFGAINSTEPRLSSSAPQAELSPSPAPPAGPRTATADDLRRASKDSRSRPFFSRHEVFAYTPDTEDEGMDSQNEDDEPVQVAESDKSKASQKETAWFVRPKRMPEWEYSYIRKTVEPLIFKKDGRKLAKPSIFNSEGTRSPTTFWIRPPEPVVSLSQHQFDPTLLYRRRIFLWLPHFFVEVLRCPNCSTPLEKNGALIPRLITDLEDNFYIVSWAYYCRDGCKHHFHGWSQRLLSSLPPYLQLAFPAVLSRKGGLSRRVLTLLRGANQHKMGPTGVRSLLFEMHTLRFNTLQLQYLESVFELEYSAENGDPSSIQPNIHAFSPDQLRFPSFGDFSTPHQYNGFVPSVPYLSLMMNKAIEREEDDANQHTACQAPDNLCLDDSHKINKHMAKVNGVPVFGALWTCMTSHYIRAQALTLTKGHDERLGLLMGIAASAKLYGYSDPAVVYSDDPLKDKALLYAAFPSLSERLTPMAAAHGLKSLSLPPMSKNGVRGW